MRETRGKVLLVLPLLALIVLCLSLVLSCQNGTVSYHNYIKIREGMTLGEVEAILGPGVEIPKSRLPETPDFTEPDPEKRSKPVVTGEQISRWSKGRIPGETEIIIGFKDGRVCDKWFWEPSL
jgi:hypothetical protein